MTGLIPFSFIPNNFVVITTVAKGGRPARPRDPVAAARLTNNVWNVAKGCWCQNPDERLVIDKVLDLLNTASRFWDPYA
jgi:hypothetical protein